ncbi:RNA deprotection pyrophosphohydrolase [Bacillus mesophilum]|uniref:Nucleoside triphosphatase YtkD n=1 Tax=Bacillus mesophilum TaxID=1071718 RepID=A0A7V7USK2_9BACI|nr:nucleoside triphosphatase YtkD [Bacillus mesophilum]KAB2329035.1 nucleoside triphosphatase YtkD [Bacillus mesophilum]
MVGFHKGKGEVLSWSFSQDSFQQPASHVLVLTSYNNHWLLTKHKERGLEFPGGKAEKGETIEEAAIREVWEETGGRIAALTYLGEYELNIKGTSYVKAVFFAEIETLSVMESYLETNGPALIEGDILHKRWEPQFSFIMQDKIVEIFIKRWQSLQ